LVIERREHERHTPKKLLEVYDRSKGNLLGGLANISQQGAMFITDRPVKSQARFRCRVKLNKTILARDELYFDAECRWCRKNVAKDRWESGYQLSMSEFDSELLSFLELSFKLGDLGDKDIEEAEVAELVSRRHLERYDLKGPLEVFEQKSYRKIGQLIDLSTCGAKLKSKRRFKEGELVRFRILLNHPVFRQEYLQFSSRCRWCRKSEDGLFDSGYLIEEITEENAAVLLHVLIHQCEPANTQPRIEVS